MRKQRLVRGVAFNPRLSEGPVEKNLMILRGHRPRNDLFSGSLPIPVTSVCSTSTTLTKVRRTRQAAYRFTGGLRVQVLVAGSREVHQHK